MSLFDSSDSFAADDRLAASLSSLCLLHCLAVPLLLGLLPAVAGGASGLHGPDWTHWALIALAAPFSLVALRKGFARHGEIAPVVVAIAGFCLVIAGAFLHGAGAIEQVLTVSGGLVIAGAHWRNWRIRRAA